MTQPCVGDVHPVQPGIGHPVPESCWAPEGMGLVDPSETHIIRSTMGSMAFACLGTCMSSDQDALDPEAEFMDREEIESLQDRELRKQVEYAYENTEHYKETFDEADVSPSDIKTRNDFQQLVPTMLKEDLRESRRETGKPYGSFLAKDPEDIDFISASSGTTGMPTYQPVTMGEIDQTARFLARMLYQGGLEPGDVAVQGGVWFHQYFRWEQTAVIDHLDASYFARGGLPFEVEADFGEVLDLLKMQDPAYMFYPESGWITATDILKEEGIDPKEAFPNLKFATIASAIVTEAGREELEEFWGVPFYEVAGPTDVMMIIEMICSARNNGWGHFFEDGVFMEILDLDTQEPVAEGERGEHVYTTFHLETTPYLRWRSEDAGIHGGYDCQCGRCHIRSKILGRTSQEIQVDDRSLFPRDFKRVRDRRGYTRSPYQLLKRDKQPQDAFEILFSGDVPQDEREQLAADLRGKYGVPATVEEMDEEDIPKKGGFKYQLIREEGADEDE